MPYLRIGIQKGFGYQDFLSAVLNHFTTLHNSSGWPPGDRKSTQGKTPVVSAVRTGPTGVSWARLSH